jgi:hypothetical protein
MRGERTHDGAAGAWQGVVIRIRRLGAGAGVGASSAHAAEGWEEEAAAAADIRKENISRGDGACDVMQGCRPMEVTLTRADPDAPGPRTIHGDP